MEKVLVLDFGGQYNQLIARRVRDHRVYAEILPYTTPLEVIKENGYKGIIFTGGPNSVFDMSSPHYSKDILELGIPVLGICYGCQLIAWMGDGEVKTAPVSEHGKIELINPVITSMKGKQHEREGCLSVPGLWGYVDRPAKVKVSAQDRFGKQFEIEGTELLAVALCHEIDHLSGILFTDKADGLLTSDQLEEKGR